MSVDESRPYDRNRVSRRRMLKRLGAGAAVAWTTPILTSAHTPAFAASPGPCREDCRYTPYFRLPDLSCDDLCETCEGGCVGCSTCVGCATCRCGISCPRITSVEMLPDGSVRFCTNCFRIVPEGGGNACWDCSDRRRVVFLEIDPNDQRCGIIPVPDDPCPPGTALFAEAAFACRCPP